MTDGLRRYVPRPLRSVVRDCVHWSRSQGRWQGPWNRVVAPRLPGTEDRMYLSRVKGPIFLRRGTSDRDVFRQVVVDREYDSVLQLLGPVKTAIDGGANIGLATIEIKRAWPSARVVAVEADERNC